MRFQRTRMSWSVLLSAWPMWSEPVTFGGGMTMQYGFALENGSARKYPRSSHTPYQVSSAWRGS